MLDDTLIQVAREAGAFVLVIAAGFMGIRWMLDRASKQDEYLMKTLTDEIRNLRGMIEDIAESSQRGYELTRKELVLQDRALKAMSMMLLSLQNTMASHDMTVRGINPDCGDTEDERLEQAVAIWSQWVKEQTALRQMIETMLDHE